MPAQLCLGLHLFCRRRPQGAGATHAWCEVFISGLGWIGFYPTNGIAESRDANPRCLTLFAQEAGADERIDDVPRDLDPLLTSKSRLSLKSPSPPLAGAIEATLIVARAELCRQSLPRPDR